MMNILYVEDNEQYRKLIHERLETAGYNVTSVDTALKAIELAAINVYDLVLSDLRLPTIDGLVLAETIKNIDSKILVVILTGDSDEESELEAIDQNVDLYLTKDKSMSVILRYISKLTKEIKDLRRNGESLYSKQEDLYINLTNRYVEKAKQEIALTPKEFEILKIFLINKNKTISREEIIQEVWETSNKEVDVRLVDNHIKKIRQKLNTFSLSTVRGYGYRWNER